MPPKIFHWDPFSPEKAAAFCATQLRSIFTGNARGISQRHFEGVGRMQVAKKACAPVGVSFVGSCFSCGCRTRIYMNPPHWCRCRSCAVNSLEYQPEAPICVVLQAALDDLKVIDADGDGQIECDQMIRFWPQLQQRFALTLAQEMPLKVQPSPLPRPPMMSAGSALEAGREVSGGKLIPS